MGDQFAWCINISLESIIGTDTKQDGRYDLIDSNAHWLILRCLACTRGGHRSSCSHPSDHHNHQPTLLFHWWRWWGMANISAQGLLGSKHQMCVCLCRYTAPHFGGIIHFNIYIWGKSLTFSRRPFESALVLVLYKPRLRLPTVWNPSLFGYNFLPGCACCARCHWWMTDITGPVLAMAGAGTRFTGIYLLTISCGTIHLSFIDSLVDGCFIERGL